MQVLKWTAERGPKGGDPCYPELVTITLDSDLPPRFAALANTGDLIAIIQWGVGTELFTVEVDWIRGAQVVVPAEVVTIQAQQTDPDANSIDVTVRAVVSRRVHPTRSRPTRTFRTAVAAVSSALVQIPNFGRRLITTVEGVELATITAQVAQAGSLGMLGRSLAVYSAASLSLSSIIEGIPLPGGAGVVEFSNSAAVPLVVVSTFELAL